jgi:hypothetical protein
VPTRSPVLVRRPPIFPIAAKRRTTPWFRASPGLSHYLLGNWTLSAVYTASSGQPFTAISLANSVGNGDRQVQRTIVNPGATGNTGTTVTPIVNSSGDVVAYLADDPNARYVEAQTGSFPNARRNSLRAPGINNADFMIAKSFGFGEQKRVQIASQFFNLFNILNLRQPICWLWIRDLGQITPLSGVQLLTTSNNPAVPEEHASFNSH